MNKGPVNKTTIINRLAKKYGVSFKEAEDAVESQFSFLSEEMKRGEFNSVRLPFFGIFRVKKRRLKHLQKKRNH